MVRIKKEIHADNEPPANRDWFEQRAAELDMSISQLSMRVIQGQRNRDALNRVLSGKRKLRPSELAALSVALGVPLNELFNALGFDLTTTSSCPLVGSVNGNAVVRFFEERAAVPAPFDHGHRYQAVEIDAPDSDLSAWQGAHLFFLPAAGVRTDALGRLSYIEIDSRQSPLIGTVKTEKGRGTVIPFGGADPIQGAEVTVATPVLWIHMT